jgi:hypothetical protein
MATSATATSPKLQANHGAKHRPPLHPTLGLFRLLASLRKLRSGSTLRSIKNKPAVRLRCVLIAMTKVGESRVHQGRENGKHKSYPRV